jgi:antiviral helicase SKI2
MQEVVERNQLLLEMASRHPQGIKSVLNSGRVIVVRDAVCVISNDRSCITSDRRLQHFSSSVAILLTVAQVPVASSGTIEQVKTYYVLALVDEDRKSGKKGAILRSYPHMTVADSNLSRRRSYGRVSSLASSTCDAMC